MAIILIACLSLLFYSGMARATSPSLPPDLGKVIYRSNENQPNHLFIIGISHPDPLTGTFGNQTLKVQAEVYRIAEWLVQNRGLELVLPEGFFLTGPADADAKGKSEKQVKETRAAGPVDGGTLEGLISARSGAAELLLKKSYPLRMQQVEDEKLYRAGYQALSKIAACDDDSPEYPQLASELNYLKQMRTAAMLQRIPEIIEQEFRKGFIGSKRAIFTIGLYHFQEILRFFREKRIAVFSPVYPGTGKDLITPMKLLSENYGACLILPRTLAQDPEILRLNGLDPPADSN